MFCAASNAIEQCQLEGRVSIFQAVKGVRMHKPGAVSTVVRTAISMYSQNYMFSCTCTITFSAQFCVFMSSNDHRDYQ